MAQLESVAVSSIIKTSAKIDFDVSDIQVSQDGQYVILRGCNPVSPSCNLHRAVQPAVPWSGKRRLRTWRLPLGSTGANLLLRVIMYTY